MVGRCRVYSIDVQAWIGDLDGDGLHDLVIRTLEKDMDLESPNYATTVKRKDAVFIWEKDHFKDATRRCLPRITLKKYRFNEEGKK